MCEWCDGFFLQFSQRIAESYPEIFDAGTTEGDAAADYFADFGWLPTIKRLAGGNILKRNEVEAINIHECLIWLACEVVEGKVRDAIVKRSLNTNTNI